MKVVAMIPAAGLGIRMGKYSPESSGTSRKQFMLLDGAPILIHTIRKFVASAKISEIFVALRREDIESFEKQLVKEGYTKPVRLVAGGRSRQESVGNCLAKVSDDTDLVIVHDAVRPFISLARIEESIEKAAEIGAVIVGIPPVDTIKQVDRTVVQSTLLRERVVLAQTPQVFRASLLRRAYEQAERNNFRGTDEASLVEYLGEPVHVIMGSDRNIKITKPADMALARLFYQEELQNRPEGEPSDEMAGTP